MGMASGEMAGRAATCPCFYAPRPWGACGLVSFCYILEARVRILIAAHYLVPIRQSPCALQSLHQQWPAYPLAPLAALNGMPPQWHGESTDSTNLLAAIYRYSAHAPRWRDAYGLMVDTRVACRAHCVYASSSLLASRKSTFSY